MQAQKHLELVVVAFKKTLTLTAPYCGDCAKHVRWYETSLIPHVTLGLIGGFFGGVMLWAALIGRVPALRPFEGTLFLALAVGAPILGLFLFLKRRFRDKPKPPLDSTHASRTAAATILGFGKQSVTLGLANTEFAAQASALNATPLRP
jgi:hypothetical protein